MDGARCDAIAEENKNEQEEGKGNAQLGDTDSIRNLRTPPVDGEHVHRSMESSKAESVSRGRGGLQ